MSIDQEWEDFVLSGYTDNAVDEEETDTQYASPNLKNDILSVSPTATDIYISTKSKIAYLNSPIDINYVFWNIPVISYSTPTCGIIKKQIKINSDTQENLNFIQEKMKDYHEPLVSNYHTECISVAGCTTGYRRCYRSCHHTKREKGIYSRVCRSTKNRRHGSIRQNNH